MSANSAASEKSVDIRWFRWKIADNYQQAADYRREANRWINRLIYINYRRLMLNAARQEIEFAKNWERFMDKIIQGAHEKGYTVIDDAHRTAR